MEDEILDVEQEEEVVNPQQAEEEGTQAQDAEGEKSSGDAGRSGEGQTSEDNRRYQAARHQGEQAGYEKAIREINERIRRSGMSNPESGERISDIEGLEAVGKAFKRRSYQARAEKEGRSVEEIAEEEENREYIRSARQRDAEAEKERKAKEQRQAWIENDIQTFRDRYPEEDMDALVKNKTFLRFCGSRLGRESMADLYEDFTALSLSAKATKSDKKERATASGGGGESVRLTAAQQRSLDEWNRNNPEMKMSAKEFLEAGDS